jgi:hypothetical protein
MKAVYVSWLDSSYCRGPAGKDDFNGIITMHSVGLLMKEDETQLWIASDTYDSGEETLYQCVTCIPKSMIVSRRDFEVGDESKAEVTLGSPGGQGSA